MATKMSAKSAAKSKSKKAAPKKAVSSTTVRTVSASEARVRGSKSFSLDNNIINIVIAEIIGTFVLTLVALITSSNIVPLYVGLTLVVLVIAIGSVSGSHVNPAVTFGLWASRKLKTSLVPFYWVAQLVGAMGALLAADAIAGVKLDLSFDHFMTFSWPIFWVELVGTAVFLFGLRTALGRNDLSNTAKALGVGLSLFVGITVATSIYSQVYTAAIAKYQDAATTAASTTKDGKAPEISHELYVKGATLNPAIALVATESTQSELTSQNSTSTETHYSRFSLEVIFATLIGAALGANLALLVNYRFRG